MKNNNRIFYLLCLILLLGFSGCGGGSSDSGTSSGNGTSNSSNGLGTASTSGGTYSFDCSGESAYNPAKAPVKTSASSGAASTTIIIMHGKTGSPTYSGIATLAAALAADNYDVIAPYMPWSGTTWDGTMCEGMLYINQLAQTEIDKGRHVIVMGHSMGAAHALLHGVISPNVAIDAYVAIAPGHFPQLSKNLQNTAAAGITLANDMVSKGMGNDFATFDIFNNGAVSQISATAYAFLSFHDLAYFPDVSQALPVLTKPVLWLGGDADSLTTNYNYPVLSANITSANSEYHTISGDHLTVLDSVPAAVQPWLSGLGF